MHLSILTPAGEVYSGDTDFVTLPASEGSMGILPNHAPIVSNLSKGSLLFRLHGKEQHFLIDGGLLEVSNNQIVVLTDKASKN